MRGRRIMHDRRIECCSLRAPTLPRSICRRAALSPAPQCASIPAFQSIAGVCSSVQLRVAASPSAAQALRVAAAGRREARTGSELACSVALDRAELAQHAVDAVDFQTGVDRAMSTMTKLTIAWLATHAAVSLTCGACC